jgi:hypothetical protein
VTVVHGTCVTLICGTYVTIIHET